MWSDEFKISTGVKVLVVLVHISLSLNLVYLYFQSIFTNLKLISLVQENYIEVAIFFLHEMILISVKKRSQKGAEFGLDNILLRIYCL